MPLSVMTRAVARHAELAPRPALDAVTRAGDEIHRGGKAPQAEPRDHDGAACMNRDLRRPPAAREPHRRVAIIPYHRRIDVPVPVDLGPTQETHFDAAVLQ
jgi:hypothetical protein